MEREMVAGAALNRPGQCIRTPVLVQVSQVLVLAVLEVHTAEEPPHAQSVVLEGGTKPEDASWLLRGAQPAPESLPAAEWVLAPGHRLCHSGVCPCYPMPAGGAKHWRHHHCGQPTSAAHPTPPLFTVSEENDAQRNMCQKDGTAEPGTEPRPSSPRTRRH